MLLSEFSMKRSYTTRAKEEQRRTLVRRPALCGSTTLTRPPPLLGRAAPAFVGRVRPWTKRWAPLCQLTVPRWVRADEKSEGLPPADLPAPAAVAPDAVEAEDERYEAWRLARIKDRQLELEECASSPVSVAPLRTNPLHAVLF